VYWQRLHTQQFNLHYLKMIDLVIGIRVESDDERMGLDLSQHGERMD
jgi:ammonia channel protein AmtB